MGVLVALMAAKATDPGGRSSAASPPAIDASLAWRALWLGVLLSRI